MQERARQIVIWGGVCATVAIPVGLATLSPYLPSRNAAYILASFAGIICLTLLFVQPLMAAGYLPGLRKYQVMRWHRWIGSLIILCVLLHVAGLYFTSPPDTIDALLLVSPTPFSVFGVIALWGVVLTGLLVALRHRLKLRYPLWHIFHNSLAIMIVAATVVHALQIEGLMEPRSKIILCVLLSVATGIALLDVRVLRRRRKQAKS